MKLMKLLEQRNRKAGFVEGVSCFGIHEATHLTIESRDFDTSASIHH